MDLHFIRFHFKTYKVKVGHAVAFRDAGICGGTTAAVTSGGV